VTLATRGIWRNRSSRTMYWRSRTDDATSPSHVYVNILLKEHIVSVASVPTRKLTVHLKRVLFYAMAKLIRSLSKKSHISDNWILFSRHSVKNSITLCLSCVWTGLLFTCYSYTEPGWLVSSLTYLSSVGEVPISSLGHGWRFSCLARAAKPWPDLM
jgi:hypothetical protein